MVKSDVVYELSRQTHITQKDADAFLDVVLHTITDALSKGQRVTFAGFGSFEVQKRNPRIGRNLHTGEAVPIPARNIPAFKPGVSLKAAVSRGRK